MISQYPCLDLRERLEAFHDGELSIDDRIAIQHHLNECSSCNAAATGLVELSSTLREFAAVVGEDQPVEALGIPSRVIERLKVEEAFSIRAQITDWFQDLHLVWAGLGASMATAICIIGSASVLHAANQERPNSMARAIAVLASPGSNDNPIRLNYDMEAPRAVTDTAIDMAEEEGEYTLSAVVSREGRVQGVEMINQPYDRPGLNAMLNEAYRMKFAPATARGDAVAVSVVWLVANTTVKGRHDEDMQALRQALRLKTQPAPIAPLPIPAEAGEPKPAQMLKPGGPEAAAMAANAAGGL
ncbi:MAG: zf-HC2 domain-containing protein [Cyanobacteria bacterium]|nr:zf-HC2 domain-containing protein [Cyanobacteriota bacterium]